MTAGLRPLERRLSPERTALALASLPVSCSRDPTKQQQNASHSTLAALSSLGSRDLCTHGLCCPLVARLWEMEQVGEVVKVEMNRISRGFCKVCDYLTQRRLWVKEKLSPKYFPVSAQKGCPQGKAIKPPGMAVEVASLFPLAGHRSCRENACS